MANNKKKADKSEDCCTVGGFMSKFSETKEHLIDAQRDMLLAVKSLMDVGIDVLDGIKNHLEKDKDKDCSKGKINKVEIS